MADISSQVQTAATAPKSVTVDNVTVQNRDIDDLIKAAGWLQRADATAKPHQGIKFNTKLIPPGAP